LVRGEPDGTSTTISYGYDLVGRRTQMSDPTGTTTWTLDPLGRTTQVSSPQGTIAYGYDEAGRRTQMTVPAVAGAPGGVVSYGYDQAGRVATVTDAAVAGAPATVSLSYLADGRVDRVDRSNGVSTRYGYDAAGRVIDMSHATAAGELVGFGYVLDANGNRVGVASRHAGVGVVSETYTLDELDRLTTVTSSTAGTSSYGYDAAGNRTRVSNAAGDTTATFDAAQRLTATTGSSGTVTYGYDLAGNLTSVSTGERYGYDGANQLVSAAGAGASHSYRFDGDGIRVGADGRPQLWDTTDTNPTLISDGAGTTTIHTPGGIGPLVASTTTAASWPLADALGSIRAQTTPTGAVVATADYDPWGTPDATNGTIGGFGYTGELTDPTGLVHLRARSYQPTLGRFTQTDTTQPNAAGTQGWNLYTYTANNPTTHTDPTGHESLTSEAILDDATIAEIEGALRVGLAKHIATRVTYVALELLAGTACAATVCDTTDNNTRPAPPTAPDPLPEPPSPIPTSTTDTPTERTRPTTPHTCPATTSVAPQTGGGCEMVPVWFGQARISAVFGDEDQTPITADPAGFRIRVFSHPSAPGVFIAINNRTLANYSLAAAPTAPACRAVPTPAELERLTDPPIPPQTALPSPVIAVTESISDPTPVSPYRVTSTVSVPRTTSPC
jgi:RHS repeat-associated protein